MQELLVGLQLEQLYQAVFEREEINMDVLMEMSHDDLQSVGVTVFGHRHRILRKVKEIAQNGGAGVFSRLVLYTCTTSFH